MNCAMSEPQITLNIIILIWFMINGKEPLIIKENVDSGRSISLQSASNSVIYKKKSYKLEINCQ